jgi:hypothetical protein
MLPSEEDYDYRLDRDPVPEDEDEAAASAAAAAHDETQGRETEAQRLHHLLDSQAAAHVYGGYVQLGERDGLPSRPDENAQDLRAAADLVRSHTAGRKWGALRRRVRSGSVRKSAAAAAGKATTATTATTATDLGMDVEKHPLETTHEESEVPTLPSSPPAANAPLTAPPGVSGNSVLSSLLALYNQPPEPPSASTSAATTPGSSRPPSPGSDGPVSPFTKRFWKKGATPPSTSVPPNSSDASWFGERGRPHTKSATSIVDREDSPGFLGALARHVEELRDDRPKSARNAAGVFGALVQNTAGMAAAAVPSASTLMPAAKRPGYHLTRYSLNEEPPSPRFKPPSRPGSASGLGFGALHRPTSPAPAISRPNSSLGLSTLQDKMWNDDSGVSRPTSLYSTEPGELRAAKSSDNLLVMRSKKKSSGASIPIPKPLSLKAVKSAETWLTGKSLEDLERASEDEKRRKHVAAEKRRHKKAREARKKQEVFIIRHVAAILARQQFILKLGRALMMFGSPTHRIETQIQATAKVLDISAQVVYLPNIMLV